MHRYRKMAFSAIEKSQLPQSRCECIVAGVAEDRRWCEASSERLVTIMLCLTEARLCSFIHAQKYKVLGPRKT